jgi:exosome complex component CSL4
VKEMTDIVVPGDLIGASEEFMAGDGTYEERGKIFAAITGTVETDKKERTVRVLPVMKTPPVLKTGDIVVGRVVDLKNAVVLGENARIKGQENREIANADQGAIHISNVKDSYVAKLDTEFDQQDIIKAKVIDEKSLRLSTVEKDLGVIKALCSRCRTPLLRKQNKLECPSCERIETRKISEDYGRGII